jgi:signal transduction histidine kinase
MEDVIGESDQLIRTFNALLMIARVEAGSAAAELQDIDLSEIVTDTVELYEPLAEDAGVTLTTAVAPGISVKGNRELVGQALANLIDNAIKYTAGLPSARIDVRLERLAEGPTIIVSDNGHGIPADKRAAAVQRFVRLDDSRSRPGTGLGLSLVEAVMHLHRGRLELLDGLPHEEAGESRPGLAVRMLFDG